MNRTGLLLLLVLSLASGCGEETLKTPDTPAPVPEAPPLIDGEFHAVITLVNEGMSAWIITAIAGRTGVANTNSQNVQIRLNEGLRYKFINLGGPNHPLDFRDSEGGYLITQDTISGKFEEDPEVGYVFNYGEGSVAFTLTDALAAEIASYNCTIHEPMTGAISVNQ